MAEKSRDAGKERLANGEAEARAELANNWAHLTASMISPDIDPATEKSLTPAQRARLGLGQPTPPTTAPAPLPNPPSAEPEPYAQPPPEPALRPVTNEPRLAPVGQSQAPADRSQAGEPSREREFIPIDSPATRRENTRPAHGETFEEVIRDRNVLSYGIAWTAFAIVFAIAISFTRGVSGDPTASAGPGPMLPALVSIGIGWAVVVASRALGKYWWLLMLAPATVLFVGPYMYNGYWAGKIEAGAHAYLSNRGTGVLIDIDATDVVSETVNTDRGCFNITRARSDNTTTVSVVTYGLETSRQQADYALAPRYAGRVTVGGERSNNRQFVFQNGRAPALINTPSMPPLDCKNTTTAPGSGAKPTDDNGDTTGL